MRVQCKERIATNTVVNRQVIRPRGVNDAIMGGMRTVIIRRNGAIVRRTAGSKSEPVRN